MFESKFFNLRGAILLMALSLFACPVLSASGQLAPLTHEQVLDLIHNLRKEKNITNETVGGTISEIVQGLLDNRYTANELKKELLKYMSKKRLLKLASAANPPEGDLLALLYYSRQSVRDNYTDRGLKKGVTRNGTLRKRLASRIWNRSVMTNKFINILENYPPDKAAVLVDVISEPYFSVRKKPVGAHTTTWAAWSMWMIDYSIRKVEFAQRSVVVKLLANEGQISLPASVDAEFIWSGWPSITISLERVFWTQDDVAELERLLGNSYYSTAAQRQLDIVRRQEP